MIPMSEMSNLIAVIFLLFFFACLAIPMMRRGPGLRERGVRWAVWLDKVRLHPLVLAPGVVGVIIGLPALLLSWLFTTSAGLFNPGIGVTLTAWSVPLGAVGAIMMSMAAADIILWFVGICIIHVVID